MKKNKVVIFTEHNAMILTNPSDLSQYRDRKDCLVNPDLSVVVKHPPHFWKMDGDEVKIMSREEKLDREASMNYKPVRYDRITERVEIVEVPVEVFKEVPVPYEVKVPHKIIIKEYVPRMADEMWLTLIIHWLVIATMFVRIMEI